MAVGDWETDVAWCAGFFEGEVTVFLSPSSKGQRHVRVSAYQKIREPLERLKETFGGQIYRDRDRGWSWAVVSRDACFALEAMLPYLIQKGPRAEAAMKWQTTLRHGLRYDKRTDAENELRRQCLEVFGYAS